VHYKFYSPAATSVFHKVRHCMTLTGCILEYTIPGLTMLKVRIELSLCSLTHQDMKMHVADEVQLDIYTSQGE